MSWTSLTGLVITALTAIISNLTKIKWAKDDPLDSKPTFNWWVLENWSTAALILLAIIGGIVGFVGLRNSAEAGEKQKQEIADLKRGNQNLLAIALAGRKSIPQIYWFIKKENTSHKVKDLMSEKDDAVNKATKQANRSIGFIHQSIREVLFPSSDNKAFYTMFTDENGNKVYPTWFGSISFRIGEFANQNLIATSGFVENDISVNDSFIDRLEVLINEGADSFALTFKFNKEWSWGEINEAVSNKFKEKKPIIIVDRWGVRMSNPPEPSFTQMNLVIILSEHPTFRISMPLEMRNYKYDSKEKKYSYELHIIKAPEIITEYSY